MRSGDFALMSCESVVCTCTMVTAGISIGRGLCNGQYAARMAQAGAKVVEDWNSINAHHPMSVDAPAPAP